MLTYQAMQAAKQTRGSRKVSFVVYVHAENALKHINEIEDREKRISKLKLIYQEAKREVLEILSRYEHFGLKVTNNLDGTPNLIVSGPASSWKKIFADDSSGLQSPDFEFIPNSLDWKTD